MRLGKPRERSITVHTHQSCEMRTKKHPLTFVHWEDISDHDWGSVENRSNFTVSRGVIEDGRGLSTTDQWKLVFGPRKKREMN